VSDETDKAAPSAREEEKPAPEKAAGCSHPVKIRIDTPGATVEVEAHAGLHEVAQVALGLFHQAGGWPQDNSRSAGFASAERRDFPPAQPSSMDWAPGGYPVQYP
jgi:hypothetical protein